MRCRECKIDVPENYTACPLCGAKTYPDEPMIQGIRYSECPRVETEKYKRNPFFVFLGVWAVVFVVTFVLLKIGVLTEMIAGGMFCAIPLLWTLVGRPLLVKQLYVGNFAVMNIWSAVLTCYVFGRLSGEAANGFAVAVPACCIAVLIALFIIVLAVEKHAKRAAPYAVLFCVGSFVGLLAVALRFRVFAPLWLVCAVLSGCLLVFLLCRYKQLAKDELCAKFSIQ